MTRIKETCIPRLLTLLASVLRRKALAIAALALVLTVPAGLAALPLGVPWALNTGATAPTDTLACSVKNSCDPGEVAVFRMSSLANAHAQTAAFSTYSHTVCCSGPAGLSTSCIGEYAAVLTLSAADNAHAASDGSYGTEVCLAAPDTLWDCQYGASCGAGYACLATISGTTNAHVADCDGVDDYGTKVCCSAEPAVTPTPTPTDTPTVTATPTTTPTATPTDTPTATNTPTATATATDTPTSTPTPTATPEGRLESVSGTIGSAGGTLSTGAGDPVEAFLSVPPGALPGDTLITIDVFDVSGVPHPPGGGQYLSRALVFSPSGTTFAIPATVTLTYTDAEVAGLNERRLGVWLFNTLTDEWELADVIYRDPDTNTLIALLPHFSTLAVRDLGTSDFDGDGCTDAHELGDDPVLGGTRDPFNRWDFYDVPAPTLFNGGSMDNRDQAVTILNDVLAVLEYTGTEDGGPPNSGGRDYDDDMDSDGHDDGLAYDRSVGRTWSGPPDDAITILTDVLLVLAQTPHSCQAAP